MTNYDVIYDVFFDKSREYEIFELSEETSKELLYGWLKGAISMFSRVCTKLSDRDEESECFNEDLSFNEIDILGEAMVLMALKPKLNNSDNFKNGLGTKDYTLFSPANLLNSIQNVYDRCFKQVRSMMNEYSFENNDIKEIKIEKK